MATRANSEALTKKAEDLLLAAQQRYEDRNPESKRLHQEATQYLPGGNTRSVLHTSPFPICIKAGHDNRLIDHDGHESVSRGPSHQVDGDPGTMLITTSAIWTS